MSQSSTLGRLLAVGCGVSGGNFMFWPLDHAQGPNTAGGINPFVQLCMFSACLHDAQTVLLSPLLTALKKHHTTHLLDFNEL